MRALPLSVNEYSTCGGISLNCFRLTSPISSSSFRVAENGLPEYFSIRIASCPKETPVGSDGSVHLDEIFAAEYGLFAGMRFIPVVSGMERKFLLLNLVRPYCACCGDIDGLFDGSRSGHTVYFCKSCIQELSEMIQE